MKELTRSCRNTFLGLQDTPTTVLLSSHSHFRPFTLSSIPAVLLPPIIFSGLVITLWTYKCIMMVIFQNKIIYMPSVPPFSRSEKVEDYAIQCRPVVWREHDLRAADGVAIKLLEGSVGKTPASKKKQVIVLYFQGNASSLPPRLPGLSAVLKALHSPEDQASTTKTNSTIFALSYRGFWTSRGRATQPGIELDAQAALQWLSNRITEESDSNSDISIILWGQSIGAGVATTALATLLTQQRLDAQTISSSPPPPLPLKVHTLILETPFLSLRTMLTALYPQTFLPYRYLWPFLRSTWDSEAAIQDIASAYKVSSPPLPSRKS